MIEFVTQYSWCIKTKELSRLAKFMSAVCVELVEKYWESFLCSANMLLIQSEHAKSLKIPPSHNFQYHWATLSIHLSFWKTIMWTRMGAKGDVLYVCVKWVEKCWESFFCSFNQGLQMIRKCIKFVATKCKRHIISNIQYYFATNITYRFVFFKFLTRVYCRSAW